MLPYGQDFDKDTRERIKAELEPWRFSQNKNARKPSLSDLYEPD